MNVVFSLQANSDRRRLVINAVCGTRWLLQQIKKGYPDKRVSSEHALGNV